MIKQEFEKITTWNELLDFCNKYNLTACNYVTDTNGIAEEIRGAISDACQEDAPIETFCELLNKIENIYNQGEWYDIETWTPIDDALENYLDDVYYECEMKGIMKEEEEEEKTIKEKITIILNTVEEEMKQAKEFYLEDPENMWNNVEKIYIKSSIYDFIKWMCLSAEAGSKHSISGVNIIFKFYLQLKTDHTPLLSKIAQVTNCRILTSTWIDFLDFLIRYYK